jgi:hypothetical protein
MAEGMLPGPLRKEGDDGGDHDETNGPAGGLALTESSALKEYTILVGPVTIFHETWQPWLNHCIDRKAMDVGYRSWLSH